ncbi:PAS domain-containing sensor histidine kinase [Roseateles chitinivorans]|uniref:PAS domain-containing sensor histidine kinase n=1 Tax=Roseateles chitinivorans TaxID=2917965 RepID=UPI003D66F6A2
MSPAAPGSTTTSPVEDRAAVDRAIATGSVFDLEHRVIRVDGSIGWTHSDRRRHEIALREADRRKDEFRARLAHELRNPLAPIRTGLHILRLAGADCAPADQVLPMLQRQVDHMVRLVDNLLEVSRITGSKIELPGARRAWPLVSGAHICRHLDTSAPAPSRSTTACHQRNEVPRVFPQDELKALSDSAA